MCQIYRLVLVFFSVKLVACHNRYLWPRPRPQTCTVVRARPGLAWRPLHIINTLGKCVHLCVIFMCNCTLFNFQSIHILNYFCKIKNCIGYFLTLPRVKLGIFRYFLLVFRLILEKI